MDGSKAGTSRSMSMWSAPSGHDLDAGHDRFRSHLLSSNLMGMQSKEVMPDHVHNGCARNPHMRTLVLVSRNRGSFSTHIGVSKDRYITNT